MYKRQVNEPNIFDCDNCSENSIILNGDAAISLLVQSEAGCTALSNVNIEAIRQVFIPTAFSPNNDGINDFFFIQSKLDLMIKNMIVFDRWGGIVFQKNDALTNKETDGWNGISKEREVDNGVYTWLVEIVFPDGQITQLSGDVLVVR